MNNNFKHSSLLVENTDWTKYSFIRSALRLDSTRFLQNSEQIQFFGATTFTTMTLTIITLSQSDIQHNISHCYIMYVFLRYLCSFLYCRILLSIVRIRVWCAPEFHNDFWQKKIFLFFKN